jgi:hypothetical protein
VLDDVLGVVESGQPVESRPKGFGHKGSAASVMPAGPFIDFSKESDSIFLRYAPLEHPCGVALVELPVDYREGLGTLHDLSVVDGIFWELASY